MRGRKKRRGEEGRRVREGKHDQTQRVAARLKKNKKKTFAVPGVCFPTNKT